MARTQEHRFIAVATPLGDDVLLLNGFTYSEALGSLFELELDLICENTDTEIQFSDIVGHNVTVRLEMAEDETRYFNGFVSRFSLVEQENGAAHYSATVVPWLWFLTRTSDCRIFQNKTVPDIIKEIFKERGFTDLKDKGLTGRYRTWEYCVQYRETDFNFVSRLMEQEGIYYYWNHENGKHTLVLADSPSAHKPYPGYDEIPYYPPTQESREQEYISDWDIEQELLPRVFTHTDFNFKKPASDLMASRNVERQHAGPPFEIFDYPGEYTDLKEGEGYALARIEEIQAEYETLRGQTTARGISAGCTFDLTNHPRDDQQRNYLVTSVSLSATASGYYSGEGGTDEFSCSFTAIDADQPYRHPRTTPKPSIPGPQTAIVVGPSGEEIYTDEHARVKVQFHWDRHGKADENSSCWIRVAQVWAGKKWGAMYIPRIGQEVIVEFLEGDPDRPIITGRVYNADLKPPYDLPNEKTKSTLKSNSSKGGGGFNEIRFEDKKGEEQIFIHAEKNLDVRVKSDRFETIGNNRHLHVVKDKSEYVEKNRHEKVDLDHMEEIGKDRHLKVKGKEAKTVDGSLSLTVGGNVDRALKADQSEEITGKTSLKVGGDRGVDVTGNDSLKVGGNLYTNATMNVVIEAGTNVTIKSGSNSISLTSAGIFIQGTMVYINSGSGATSGSAVALKTAQPVSPAAPEKALDADIADPGKVAAIKAEQMKKKEGKYGSTPFTPHKPDEDKTSWIEIEMVDEEDNPVPGERYKITLPDGSVAEGTLDNNGFARVQGFDKGDCKVSFHDLDKEAWEKL